MYPCDKSDERGGSEGGGRTREALGPDHEEAEVCELGTKIHHLFFNQVEFYYYLFRRGSEITDCFIFLLYLLCILIVFSKSKNVKMK